MELAALTDPTLIYQAVAQAIDIREMPGQPLNETLSNWFRNRELLLILDNCEHLIDACAGVAEELLRAGPQLTMLTTSREPLRIGGEMTWPVPSLSLPDPARTHTVDEALPYEAVQLFLERARSAQPGFELNRENTRQVATLCYQLDGIPLAIELAASRVRGLTIEQILERMHNRFQLLGGGSRTALSRQQTLRATLDWSYDLLDAQERLLFARLSLFAGGFDLAAVEQICAAAPLDPASIVDLLLMLVDRSLVVVSSVDGTSRYSLLETMREYARERMAGYGETDQITEAHARYYSAFASNGASHLRGAGQIVWLARLEREHDNLRQALDWHEAQARQEDPEQAMLLVGSLYWFWYLRDHFSEGRSRVNRLLGMGPAGVSPGRGMALVCAAFDESIAIWRTLDDPGWLATALVWSGWIELFHGLVQVARERHLEGLDLATQVNDEWHIAMATLGLGFDTTEADEFEAALDAIERSLELFQAIEDYWGTTSSLKQLASLNYRMGDFDIARQRAVDVLAMGHAEDDKWLEIQFQSLIGEIARAQGDYEAAAHAAEISMKLADEMGNVATRAWTLRDIGFISLAAGDLDASAAQFIEGMEIFESRDYPLGIACTLAGLAGVALACGKVKEATWILGSVEASLAARHLSFAPADRIAIEQFTASARDLLGEPTFTTIREMGAEYTLESTAGIAKMHFLQK